MEEEEWRIHVVSVRNKYTIVGQKAIIGGSKCGVTENTKMTEIQSL